MEVKWSEVLVLVINNAVVTFWPIGRIGQGHKVNYRSSVLLSGPSAGQTIGNLADLHL